MLLRRAIRVHAGCFTNMRRQFDHEHTSRKKIAPRLCEGLRNRRRNHPGFLGVFCWKPQGDSMDLKLSMLFLLIAVMLGLPHLSDEKLASIKQQFASMRWGKLGRH